MGSANGCRDAQEERKPSDAPVCSLIGLVSRLPSGRLVGHAIVIQDPFSGDVLPYVHKPFDKKGNHTLVGCLSLFVG